MEQAVLLPTSKFLSAGLDAAVLSET